ncbi:MAG TPA: FeoB-associated Cys-rich membrane protein [Fastidiosipila sp.]|nr:FeoB-associated Cys-rich membrane protein [Fastidiosipila sp.]
MSPGTWIVGIVLLAILALVVRSLIKARKSGCGGSCAGCASESYCRDIRKKE